MVVNHRCRKRGGGGGGGAGGAQAPPDFELGGPGGALPVTFTLHNHWHNRSMKMHVSY